MGQRMPLVQVQSTFPEPALLMPAAAYAVGARFRRYSMLPFLRIAVGTLQPRADASPVLWALMEALERRGLRVQSFLSRACFASRDGATTITGQSPRHLDSWLMPRDVCASLFLRGCRSCDVAIVEGELKGDSTPTGGSLDTLCDWLALPRVAVVDCTTLAQCQLPSPPPHVDGVLLDQLSGHGQFVRMQTTLEGLWGLPVLGGLSASPSLKQVVDNIPIGAKPSEEVCQKLGDNFLKISDPERILEIAASRAFPSRPDSACEALPPASRLHVAVAFDEAFNCYFPDTLDALEMQGAAVSDFSPLRDERLPADADIVYFGCGHPERFAVDLGENQCMLSALRNHLCNGRRIYAEGGGLAYLCQHLDDGAHRRPMVGALPATAHLEMKTYEPRAVEFSVARDCWLAPTGTRLRGYVNPAWRLQPTGPLHQFAEAGHELDLVGRHQAIGSRVHLHFAAHADGLGGFFAPHAAAMDATASLSARQK